MHTLIVGSAFTSFIEALQDWATKNGVKMTTQRLQGILIFSFQTEEDLVMICTELKRASLAAPSEGDVPCITHFDSGLFAKDGKTFLVRGHYCRKMQQVLDELPRICARPRDMFPFKKK